MSQTEAVPHIPEADSFPFQASISAIKQALRGHIGLVLATMATTIALVLAYISIWPPTFQAEVMVAAVSDSDQQRNAFYQSWNIFRRDALTDEATLMTATPVLQEVIKRLDLKYDEVYHPFTSYVVHLWGKSWVGQTYRKIKYWFFPPKPSPFTLPEVELERFKVLKDFRDGVSVQQVGDASIGLLIVKGSTQRVAEIANTMVDVYLEQRRERYVNEARQAYESLHVETEKALQEVQTVESEMKNFYADNGMLLLFEKDRVQLTQWLELRAAIFSMEAQIADNENALRIINTQLNTESKHISSDRMFRENALKDRLTKLEIAMADAKQTYQPNSPEVRNLEAQIKAAMAGIDEHDHPIAVRNTASIQDSYEQLRTKKSNLESMLAGAKASLQIKKVEAEGMKTMLDRIPRQMQLNHEFERKQLIHESKYSSLNEKLTMAAVSMATAKSAPSAMRVVDYASTPEKPTWPNTKLLLLAAVLIGLLVGTVGALLVDLVVVRVTRYRLWSKEGDYRLFAIVDQDEKFLATLYPPGQGTN